MPSLEVVQHITTTISQWIKQSGPKYEAERQAGVILTQGLLYLLSSTFEPASRLLDFCVPTLLQCIKDPSDIVRQESISGIDVAAQLSAVADFRPYVGPIAKALLDHLHEHVYQSSVQGRIGQLYAKRQSWGDFENLAVVALGGVIERYMLSDEGRVAWSPDATIVLQTMMRFLPLKIQDDQSNETANRITTLLSDWLRRAEPLVLGGSLDGQPDPRVLSICLRALATVVSDDLVPAGTIESIFDVVQYMRQSTSSETFAQMLQLMPRASKVALKLVR